MSLPVVSVLISVFNGSNTIIRCIDSILQQTFHNFEIVVVNDGSSDDTLVLLQSYDDSRIKIIDLPHVGLPKALNEGLKHCKGKYVARMDADDWSYPTRIEQQVNMLDNNASIDIVTGIVEYAGDRSSNEGYARHVDWVNSLKDHDDMYLNRFEDAPIVNPSCMFRKQLIDQYGPYSEASIPEDYEFWLRMFHHGRKFYKLPEPVLKWSDLKHRLTRTSANYSSEAFQKVKAQYLVKDLQIPLEQTNFYIFGTGKQVKRKSKALKEVGISSYKYIEVKDSTLPEDTIHYTQLPAASGNEVVLSYVGDRNGKIEIGKYLEQLGYRLGTTYYFMC